MAFKLGNRSTRPNTPMEKPMVFRKHLEGSTLGEANMDGTINIDASIKPGSKKEARIIKHEMSHIEDIESGRAAYGDDWVMWEDRVYFRKNVDGINVIDGPNGRWPEGDKNHPWEAKAIQAEKE
jgi:hypothetical protein